MSNWISNSIFGMVVAAALLAAGCGGPPTTSVPKKTGELTEKEKQQIRELNEQRAQEWGTTNKPDVKKYP
jgi:hypothetical protein